MATASSLDLPSSAELLLFRNIVAAVKEAVVVTEAALEPPGPRIEYVNPSFSAMTGYTSAEVVGRTPRLLQGPDTARSELDRLRRALSTDSEFHGSAVNYRKDGSHYHVDWQVSGVRDE